MGVICKENVCVWGDNWDIKIFNVTNCERRRREATFVVVVVCVCVCVCGGELSEFFWKNEGHCGSDFCFLSSSVYCTCSEYLNISRR